jgi:hypothetical protein
VNPITAIHDDALFKPFLEDAKGSIVSWHNWEIYLRALYGLPIQKQRNRDLVKSCTGRDAALLPRTGFQRSLCLVGRRSGKSKLSSVIGATEASLSGKERLLSKGERGMVAIISPTRLQSQIVTNYLRAIYETPLLAQEVVQQDKDGFLLRNNVRIQILTGTFSTVRGFALLAAILDELAFFGLTDESRTNIKSDSELVRAVTPALSLTNGKLIGISTPYRRAGYCWQQYQKNFGNDKGKTLLWNCPSTTMNPMLPQSVVDEALEEDLASGKSEFLAEFRDDIAAFISPETVALVVAKGRKELLPTPHRTYTSFCDLSGGRGDDGALAISHKDTASGRIVLDCLRAYKAPYSPQAVIRQMSTVLRSYGLRMVTGDNYSAEFCAERFRANGIGYRKCDKPKSQLYLEVLPRITSGECELLDDPILISQLCGLERRTRSGGADKIDHPGHAKDDVANAAAGAVVETARPKKRIGGWGHTRGCADHPRERLDRFLRENNAIIRSY